MSHCWWEKEVRSQLEWNGESFQVGPGSRSRMTGAHLWLVVGNVGHMRGALNVRLLWVVRLGGSELQDCCFQESFTGSGAGGEGHASVCVTNACKGLRVWYF